MNSEFKAMLFQIHHNAVKGAEPWDDEPAYDETRFRIVSAETGEILDDAQGYGYKTAQKAYAAWGYKTRDKSKDAAKRKKDQLIRTWMKEHRSEARALDGIAFEIAKGSWGPDDKFNASFIEKQLKEWGFADLPFTGKEYLYTMTHKPRK